METSDKLSHLISNVASDKRLKRTHISLYVALRHAWVMNRFQQATMFPGRGVGIEPIP